MRQSISTKKDNNRYRASIDSDDLRCQRLSLTTDLQDKLKAIEVLNKTLESQKKELSVLKNKVNQISSPVNQHQKLRDQIEYIQHKFIEGQEPFKDAALYQTETKKKQTKHSKRVSNVACTKHQENRQALKPSQSEKAMAILDKKQVRIPTIATKLQDTKYQQFEHYIAINNQVQSTKSLSTPFSQESFSRTSVSSRQMKD